MLLNCGFTIAVSYILICFSGMTQTIDYFSQTGKYKTEGEAQVYSSIMPDVHSEKNNRTLNNVKQSGLSVISNQHSNPANPLAGYGLIFQNEIESRMENNLFTDTLQLISLSDTAQALQFKLSINKSSDDSTILIFQNIQKGNDVRDTSWVLDYNIIKGSILPNGASKDEVLVLLYNTNLNGGLLPGNYNKLLKVNYRVADIPDLQNNIKSSFKISNTIASTSLGVPVDITPSRDELKVFAINENFSSGLVFEQDSVYRLEDNSYTDILQLKNLGYKAQALQFRLLINKDAGDSIVLTFQNIQKGADVSSSSWVLDYNVIRGSITANGGSIDEILVLLYNLNHDNGLPARNYYDLLKVNYRVADLQPLQDSIKSSIRIADALASTFEGLPVDITPSRDVLTIIARNRVGFYGDVNGDGCIDILDMMKVVDHIVGNDSLDAEEFERADIAPWITGSPVPSPDGIVNVQDLSLLQNIILTNVYPDGTIVNECSYSNISKTNDEGDSKVTLYINKEGITVYLNTQVKIRAAQMEFGNVGNDPGNMIISTDLGEGYYKCINKFLRILLYDRQGIKLFGTDENLLANMSFHITQPENITINKLILEDINNQMIPQSQVEIVYGTPPALPLNYMLYQNYPNPFNPATTIKYSLPGRSNVILKIYDILGKEVASPVNEVENRGNYFVNFSAVGLASGIYFYRIQAVPFGGQAGGFTQTKKMIVLK